MRGLLLICAGLLFLALFDLPIGYYTFLRIVVTIGSVAVIVKEFENGLGFWAIAFGLIAILFNPIIPVYLHDKELWMPIDIISALLFLIKSFSITNSQEK
jgi:predicted membrane protein